MSAALDISVSWILVESQLACSGWCLESRTEKFWWRKLEVPRKSIYLFPWQVNFWKYLLFVKLDTICHSIILCAFKSTYTLEKQSRNKKNFLTKIEEVNRWAYNPLSSLTSIYCRSLDWKSGVSCTSGAIGGVSRNSSDIQHCELLMFRFICFS